LTEVEREGLRTIRQLVDLGARFGQPPEGNLDVTGSSPEQIDLAASLEELIPGEWEDATTESGKIDVPHWAKVAVEVLKEFEGGTSWDGLSEDNRRFVVEELDPFLKRLLEQPAEDSEE
jgi:hypothetical protein